MAQMSYHHLPNGETPTYAFALSAIRSASIPISRNCPVGEVIWPQK
jgi:hypothetical protein